MVKKHKLNNFLSDYPLYKPFKAVENYTRTCNGFTSPYDIEGETFSYFCEKEEEFRTFEVEIPICSGDYWGKKPGNRVPKELLTQNSFLDYTQHFVAKCKSCKQYHIDFLLHVWSDKSIPEDTSNLLKEDETGKYKPVDEFDAIRANIFIEKVGIRPDTKITIEKYITKYFDRESNTWYYKGRKALTENYGIGAFAYFRRIIEKELLNITNELSNLDSSDSDKIKSLLADYKKTGKTYLIYENVFEYLPTSLQSLGDNPLKILYSQTSQGLHNLSEEECLARSEQIDLILKFVIKKINEEKSEILNIRNAIKALKPPTQ